MNYYKGSILTVDASNSVCTYLVEDDGKIIYTGNELPQEYKNAEVVNLAESNEEIARMIGEYAASTSAKTIIAFGAYTTLDEKERGSLEAGKVADMVILSENPYTVPSESLKDIKVEGLPF